MNLNILRPDVQELITSFQGDSSRLAFSGSPFPSITVQELLVQINGREKAKVKLPTWFNSKGIYFPRKLNLEQTSSEITANYKASLVSGRSIADLTGGFGIDTAAFSETFDQVTHFEQNDELSKIAAHNFAALKKSNIECITGDSLLKIKSESYDVIYVDPARRHDRKGKVFQLADCAPSIPTHLDYLLDRCKSLIIKTSPMLDISLGISELKHVHEIHVIAVSNEVKELIWLIRKESANSIKMVTRNFVKNEVQEFDFQMNESATPFYGLPKQFLYEPNAAILKSGAFQLISQSKGVEKLHLHSHLYTSSSLQDFPGRRFEILEVIPYSKNEMKTKIAKTKANVTVRNFPENVLQLRKKWKISEGGTTYLFFTTNKNDERIVLVCTKVE